MGLTTTEKLEEWLERQIEAESRCRRPDTEHVALCNFALEMLHCLYGDEEYAYTVGDTATELQEALLALQDEVVK